MAPTDKIKDQPAAAQASNPKLHYPFWFGGSASCCAAAVTHPLDLGESFFLIAVLIL